MKNIIKITVLLLFTAYAPDILAVDTDPVRGVENIPEWLHADPFYKKYYDADGIPVISSGAVRDEALVATGEVISRMLSKCAEVKKAMVQGRVKFMVIGEHENVSDIPEYKYFCNTPERAAYWNQRARGFGGAPEGDQSASCGEENVLCLPGDRYRGESILVHEFAHIIHSAGIAKVHPEFDEELESLRLKAIEEGLWKDTYAITNKEEYFAEAVQSFFNCNRYSEIPDGIHNRIDTREKLRQYDPRIYRLLLRFFEETDLGLCSANAKSDTL